MFELAQLIRSYLAGELDYSTFRREYVVRFLSVRRDDDEDAAVVEVESLCADVAEGEIASEDALKAALRALPYVAQGAPLIVGMAYYAASSSCTSSTFFPTDSVVCSAQSQILREMEYV